MKLPVLEAPAGRIEARFSDKKPLYSQGEALAEANRCLYCADAPCIAACPTAIDIPTFIRKIATGNPRGSARTILSANVLGRSCAHACPVEVLCAGACVYERWGREPIAIGRLQRYAVETALGGDAAPLFAAAPPTQKRVALVGSGPASIAAAGMLALQGHTCEVFERHALPGGLNSLGIAPYKMKLEDAFQELSWVFSLGRIALTSGVEVTSGPASGPHQRAAADLLAQYDAVFLGLGLGADARLGIPGEDGPGVFGATALIERLKTDPGFTLGRARRALVVGGGNTALDIAHELALLGLESAMVYRRSREEMSGYAHELLWARSDGVRLLEHRRPLEVVRDGAGQISGLRVATALPDLSPGEEVIPADLVVMAIGQSQIAQVAQAFPGVMLDARGRVKVDPVTYRTGHPRVWSAGDGVNGGKEVVNAVAEAKVAVQDMRRVLGGG